MSARTSQLWAVAGAAVIWELYGKTTRSWLALGDSEEACRLQGLQPGRIFLSAYAVGGFLLGLGALVYLTQLSTIEPARVALPTDLEARLVFDRHDGPDPRFGDDLLGLRFGEDEPPGGTLASDVSLAGIPSDPGSVALAPGRYRYQVVRKDPASHAKRRMEGVIVVQAANPGE